MANAEAEALKAEGNKLVGEGKWPEAEKKYKKAIKIDPTCAVYFSNLALCCEKMEDVLSFEKAAKKCVELDPCFVKGYYRLAKAQVDLWEYERARATRGGG